jgi:Flp pilus assembly pilin Flp
MSSKSCTPKRGIRSQTGATMVENSVVAGLIVVACIVGLTNVRHSIGKQFCEVVSKGFHGEQWAVYNPTTSRCESLMFGGGTFF